MTMLLVTHTGHCLSFLSALLPSISSQSSYYYGSGPWNKVAASVVTYGIKLTLPDLLFMAVMAFGEVHPNLRHHNWLGSL